MLIPERIAIRLIDDGWCLINNIIMFTQLCKDIMAGSIDIRRWQGNITSQEELHKMCPFK